MNRHFDVIVIGGGHAGSEAALAAARTGAQTLLLTQNLETLGQMSCNPAIGGVGKGHLVREIDALGGMMALAADDAGIQFRRLNSSRGPAVRATRAQCDRALYKIAVRKRLDAAPNLAIFQSTVEDLILRQNRVVGVVGGDGLEFFAAAVVLTTGTFLGGVLHVGQQQTRGGRAGCAAATALAARLRELKLPVGRLKTGTPPRLDGRTIDFSQLEAQPGDVPRPVFSFVGDAANHPPQKVCHITHTTPRAHDIIRAALSQSPLFSGAIAGVGPRYCPSIEDKITRFAERDSHRIFLEPEGLHVAEYYPNGISTSLPFAVQEEFVRAVAGLENARITRPGYAIEYDFFDPRELLPSLQTRALPGLFFAGQINGTTGYEEAAAQGLVAGVNAARLATDKPPWLPARNESYIGVLIDDLTVRGVIEPYRMFTSRAECRLSLREDNADLRLTEKGRDLGLVDDSRWARFCARRDLLAAEEKRLTTIKMRDLGFAEARGGQTAAQWLRAPAAKYADLGEHGGLRDAADIAEMEARYKYAGYIEHQRAELARAAAEEAMSIPDNFDAEEVPGLSREVRDLFRCHHPTSMRQARRLSGITPAALALVAAHLKTQARRRAA